MVHAWTQATYGTGNAVRVVLFDYKKAFDLIDHKIFVTKIIQLPMPTFIKRWVIDFLMNRQQRVKLQETVCLNGLTFLPVSLKEPNWNLGYSSPSRRREAPCEGTNSPRLFTPGETKALAESKVHQISRAWVTNDGWSSSLISKIWRTVMNSGH